MGTSVEDGWRESSRPEGFRAGEGLVQSRTLNLLWDRFVMGRILTGGRERLHLDLRAALHDDRVRTGRTRCARCWRKQELRIWDRCGDGNWLCELRDHHDFTRAHPADSRVPSEKRLPDEAVRTPKWRSHTVVRLHEHDARRAGRTSHNDAVAVKVAAPVPPVATPCVTWRRRDEQECNR